MIYDDPFECPECKSKMFLYVRHEHPRKWSDTTRLKCSWCGLTIKKLPKEELI